ncbi:MAG: amino acid decarboxylase [Bryobacterales bacterium]|nr:amino acid decarboxylase [Bryobacterales bacterium]
MGHQVVDWLADYQLHPERFPVLSRLKPGEVIDALPASGPAEGEPMDAILRDFERTIVPGLTHWNHPGFMAYFANTASGPGVLGEMLAAGLNANGILWKTSPALTELEQVTLSWLRQWMGLPETFFGMIHDTASIGVMHAIAAARVYACPEGRTTGEWPLLVIYCSEHAHSSVEKGAIALGIGQQNVRKIAADEKFQMDPAELSAAIEHDLAHGFKPFCVVATVGTTSTTSIDPVPEIAAIAEKHDMWLHVDCAYAGSAAVSPKYRHFLNGADRAHSLITNPHKWLFTPVDLSVLYTSRPDILRQAFSLVPEFLRSKEDPRALNYMEYGVPLGRRFRALKLWFILRYYGQDTIAKMIEEHIRWAQELAREISADPDFEICAPTPMSVVCLRKKTSDEENEAILERVNASGEIFLSHTRLHGKYVIRIAIGNMGTTREHVFRAWELIRQ